MTDLTPQDVDAEKQHLRVAHQCTDTRSDTYDSVSGVANMVAAIKNSRLSPEQFDEIAVNNLNDQPKSTTGSDVTLLYNAAAVNRQREIVEALLEKGVSPDTIPLAKFRIMGARDTPLMGALREGDEDMVALLIAAGADVNKKDSKGATAVMRAMQGSNVNLAAALLDHPDADLTVRDNRGKNIVDYAYGGSRTSIGRDKDVDKIQDMADKAFDTCADTTRASSVTHDGGGEEKSHVARNAARPPSSRGREEG